MVTMRQVLGVGLAVGAATLLAAAAQERHEPPAPKAPAAEQAERPKAEDDAWEKEPLYASMIRMRPVTQAIHSYAGKHDDHLPPDLGSLLAFIPEKDDDGRTRTPAERAAFFLSPRDAAKIKVPEKPTPEWVNANTSFVYLGKGDIVLAKVEDWGKATILHEKSGEGYPSPNPEMKGAPTFGVAFVDGHIEALLKADADKAIARGKEVLEAARPKQPQKPEPPKK